VKGKEVRKKLKIKQGIGFIRRGDIRCARCFKEARELKWDNWMRFIEDKAICNDCYLQYARERGKINGNKDRGNTITSKKWSKMHL